VLPFFVGHIYDLFAFKYVTVVFLTVQLLGQLLFCLALHMHSLTGAIMALVIFGSGSSAVSVAQRALVVDSYVSAEGYGLGCTHSSAAVAKCVGKLSFIPTVLLCQSFTHSHEYEWALLAMCVYTVMSLGIACYMMCVSDTPSFHTCEVASECASVSGCSSPSERPRSASVPIHALGFW
jgi:hypothetical protein